MENASKALIIAGAILLAILIISLGIMIFTQARSAISGAGMSDAEVHAFNQKFLKYDGKQTGSQIRSMVQEVMINNSSEEASASTYVTINVANGTNQPISGQSDSSLVSLGIPTGTNTQPTFGTNFKNTQRYTVNFVYGSNARIVVICVK